MGYVFEHGSGSKSDPYQIWTAKDLNGIRNYKITDEDDPIEFFYFKQMANIDLSEYDNWEPISYRHFSGPFSYVFGKYDGDGYSISGLKSTGYVLKDYNEDEGRLYSLFGESSIFEYENIHLKDYYFKLIGNLSYIVAPLGTTVLGGFKQCSAQGEIEISSSKLEDDYQEMTILGLGKASNKLRIEGTKCLSDGRPATIENCYARSKIIINGELPNSCSIYGIAPSDSWGGQPVFKNCYADIELPEGVADNENYYGISYLTTGPQLLTKDTNYYNSDFFQVDYPEYDGIPKTTIEMKQMNTYENWDFDTIWGINTEVNDGYPFLQIPSLEEPTEPIVKYEFTYGHGTREDPYQIWEVQDLIGIRDYCGSYNEETLPEYCFFKQMANIDTSNLNNWNTIGDYYELSIFWGEYNGNGFYISGFKWMLFGDNQGVLANITLKDMANDIPFECGIAVMNRGIIKNCHITIAEITEESSLGIAAENFRDDNIIGVVQDCSVIANTTIINARIGITYTNNSKIKRCCLKGDTVSDEIVESGLVFFNEEGGEISDSYAIISLNSPKTKRCGITGYSSSDGIISNCYVVGNFYGNGSIKIGIVSLATWSSPTIINSYYNNDYTSSSSGTGVPVSQLKIQSTFEDWDFDEIWDINPDINNGYPFLREPKYEFSYGDGTENNPYQIWSIEDLNGIRSYLTFLEYGLETLQETDFLYFKQMVDINFSNYDNWETIDSPDTDEALLANYDGNNFSMIAFNWLLLKCNYGKLKNINLVDVNSKRDLSGIVEQNYGLIQNCNIMGANPTPYSKLGITFYNNDYEGFSEGVVEKCSVVANGTADQASVGVIMRNDAILRQSFLISSAISEYYELAVGLVFQNNGTISDSFAIVGVSSPDIQMCGVTGSSSPYTGSVSNCYVVGTFNGTGTKEIGVVVIGGYSDPVINNSYFNNEEGTQKYGTGLSISEMRDKNSYENWDFTEIWDIDGVTNEGFPFLRGVGFITSPTNLFLTITGCFFDKETTGQES